VNPLRSPTTPTSPSLDRNRAAPGILDRRKSTRPAKDRSANRGSKRLSARFPIKVDLAAMEAEVKEEQVTPEGENVCSCYTQFPCRRQDGLLS
jgi:hypothetical protein